MCYIKKKGNAYCVETMGKCIYKTRNYKKANYMKRLLDSNKYHYATERKYERKKKIKRRY